MNLNIYNETGMGEAVTNIQYHYYYGNIDIEYQDIDFTKEKFESNNVRIRHNRRLDTSSHITTGKIEGSLSGESNSNGKFNVNINDDIEIDGIFTGKEKQNCNTYCDCSYCPSM